MRTIVKIICFSLGVLFLNLYIMSVGHANVLGVSYQNFFPTPDQTDYITVHSSESIRAKKWRFHFFGTASGNNLFAYNLPNSNQQSHEINDVLVGSSFGGGVGITSNFEWGFTLPMQWWQSISPGSDKPYLEQRGVTLIYNQFKYVFQRRGELKDDDSGAALVVSLGLPNTRKDGFLGHKQAPIFTIEGVYDRGSEIESYSFNLGYRFRNAGEAYKESPVLPLRDQLILSAGTQHRFQKTHSLSWIAEAFGSYPIVKGDYERPKDISSLEGIIGVRGGKSKANRWTLGMGTELLKGSMSPDWRFFGGWSWDFNWTPKTVEKDIILEEKRVRGDADNISDPLSETSHAPNIEDADRDHVEDDYDMCPRTPKGVRVDHEGCPLDSDGDSIADFEDRCPNTSKGVVVNRSGCPIM